MGQSMQTTIMKLGTGTLEFELDSCLSHESLFCVAERINPKRSFLFVSTVLGRHIPVRPRDHLAAVIELVDQIPLDRLAGPMLVMGFAETAVGLGAAVARQIGRRSPNSELLYMSTTRHPVPGQEWIEFSEEHSHSTLHYVMSLSSFGFQAKQAVTLVLVDDEMTTGNTFAALIGALRYGGLSIGQVLLLTLTDWSNGEGRRIVSECVPDIQVEDFALMQGRWKWTREASATLPELPVWPSSVHSLPYWNPDDTTAPLLRAPRLGLRMREDISIALLADQLGSSLKAEPILVIGTGEHVWGPMLLAERLEQSGADVCIVATTRSPIHQGEVIRHKLTFPDHFGLGVPMYLHNVPPCPDAHVIIMTETDASGICPELRSYLGRGQIVDGSARVTEFGKR